MFLLQWKTPLSFLNSCQILCWHAFLLMVLWKFYAVKLCQIKFLHLIELHELKVQLKNFFLLPLTLTTTILNPVLRKHTSAQIDSYQNHLQLNTHLGCLCSTLECFFVYLQHFLWITFSWQRFGSLPISSLAPIHFKNLSTSFPLVR